MRRKLRIVVLGMMGRIPFAGIAWQVLHYLEGFRSLGHEVYYVEDTDNWPYDPEQNTLTDDCRYAVRYIGRLMAWCGLPGRWGFRFRPAKRTFGLSESQLLSLFEKADVLINLHGATLFSEEHLRTPIRVYLETDPVRAQIQLAEGDPPNIEQLRAHTHHFTYGENIGTPNCAIPTGGFNYRPTRQTVILDWWRTDAGPPLDGSAFTTIGNWRQTGRDIKWKGTTYAWSKHLEFLKFIDLPRLTSQPLELALACEDAEVIRMLTSHGWRIADAIALSKDIFPYRDYILGSRGEFTVAKDQNVRLRSGWFSDRSACYLAASKPVITQDTGFSTVLPTGKGLFAFNTTEEIVAALDAISFDYKGHRRAAREIAEEYFRADKVLAKMIAEL